MRRRRYYRYLFTFSCLTFVLCSIYVILDTAFTDEESLQPLDRIPLDALSRRGHDNVKFNQSSSATGNSTGGCRRFLYENSNERIAGNGRAVLPLLLTSIKYHGLRRLRETLPTWLRNFIPVQGNVDLVLFYAYPNVTVAELLRTFDFVKATEDQLGSNEKIFSDLRNDVTSDLTLLEEEWSLLRDGYFFFAPVGPRVLFRVVPVKMKFPIYIQRNWSLLEDPTWRCCGCPPYCPLHQAPVEYIQGTRWYSHDMFDQPIVRRYSFWVKIDVDIDFFRQLEDRNLVQLLISSGHVLGHTGFTYNGRGCSYELHEAIEIFLRGQHRVAVSNREDWWMQDDKTYYTNFVVGSVNFFLHPEVRELTYYLNEYYNGFFKHRWTDQSLLHKVLGVFCGPHEEDFSLNWRDLRCTKKKTTPTAVFYHSKRRKNVRFGRPCR